jgi:hypothetical protein
LVGPGRRDGRVGPRDIQGTASAKQKLLRKVFQVIQIVVVEIEKSKSRFQSESTFYESRYATVRDNICVCLWKVIGGGVEEPTQLGPIDRSGLCPRICPVATNIFRIFPDMLQSEACYP